MHPVGAYRTVPNLPFANPGFENRPMIIKRLRRLPPLAWLVEVNEGPRVVCGDDVEVGPNFLVEGCWDGPFAAAGFHTAENFFGSGFRESPDGALVFSAATDTLDCLYVLARASRPIVSNSLPLLLAYAQLELDPNQNYVERLATVTRGIRAYDRAIASDPQWVLLRVVHANFTLSADGITELPKPVCMAFGDRNAYCAYLSRALSACLDNARDPARRRRYEPLTCCSSGYDSNMIAALAAPLGCARAISLTTARSGESDSGAAVAQRLGLKCRERPRPVHATEPQSEMEFLAGGAGGGGDSVLREFEDELKSTVFLTGYHGDAVWDKYAAPTPDFVRKDDSGCGLTEFRLRVGFFHLPLAFVGGAHADEILRISNSIELREFSVGGNYDRPICRSVLEQAGVPRDLFGMQKKAVTIALVWDQSCLHPASRAAFRRFVRKRGFVCILLVDRVLNRVVPIAWRFVTKLSRLDQQWLGGRLGIGLGRCAQSFQGKLQRFQDGTATYANLLFLWALEACVQARKQVLVEDLADLCERRDRFHRVGRQRVNGRDDRSALSA
jgi:hypothetical protein